MIEARAAQNLSSTSVVGERRLGKSSLLYEAARRLNQASPAGPHRYCAVYLDCQDAACRTASDLLASAAAAILAALDLSLSEDGRRLGGHRQRLAGGDGLALAGFGDVLTGLRAERVRPLLFLDEFEKLLSIPDEFDDDFFDGLRALANRGDVGLVTASQATLQELFPLARRVSNFPNIFVSRRIGDLTAEEAHELVEVQSAHPLDRTEQELALTLAGTHPLRLQVACGEVWRMKEEGERVTEPALRARYDDVIASWGAEVRP